MKKDKEARQYDIHRSLPSHHHRRSDGPPAEEVISTDQIEKRRSWWKRMLYLLLLLFFLAAGLIGWDIYNFSNASQQMFGSGNLFNLLSTSDLKGAERSRVNVLIAGYSVDDPGHPGANLTDSIILLSMDTANHTGYMLSVPRDLYVKIPGHGYGKINEVYKDNGMLGLEQILSDKFGVPVDYYLVVNYGAVRGTVNALGGISLNIQSPDERGLYDPNISPAEGGPLRLANGQQTLDGQAALNLTRARGETYGSYGFPRSDFDRTLHQRQVFTAIKDRAGWSVVLNPLKNRQLFNALGENIQTNLTLSEVRRFYGLFNSIPTSQLQSISLNNINGRNLLTSTTTFYGQSALMPTNGLNDYSDIQAAIEQLNQ